MIVNNSNIAANKTGNIVTTRVTSMASLFQDTSFNGDISHWDTAAVTDMNSMFFYAQAFNGDISSWNTAAVTSMRAMFGGASAFNQNLSGWCVQNNFDSESYLFKSDANSIWVADASKRPDWDGASCP